MTRTLTTAIAAVVGALALGGTAAAGVHGDPVRLSAPTTFQANCDGVPPVGTLYPNVEVQPHVAVDPTDPRHVVSVWQQDRWSGVGARGLVTATSFDGGAHWIRATPAFARCEGGAFWRATDAQASIAPDGTAYVVSLSLNTAEPQGDHAIQVSRSIDGGTTWQAPATLVREGADTSTYVFNDLPSVTADPDDSRFGYVTWNRILDAPLRGPVYLARTTDGGSSWQAPRPIYDPGPGATAQAVRIVVLPGGSLVALFAVYTQAGSSSYQAIRSTDRGVTWSAASKIADVAVAGTKDPVSGSAVRDGGGVEAQIAVAANGTLYAVWQDSRFAAGARDGIAVSSSTDGGRSWTPPRQVNPDPSVQAFSPGVAVTAGGTVGVSYSVVRGNAADDWISESTDGGRTWSTSPLSGPFSLATAPKVDSGALYLGDYHGMVATGACFLTVFPRTNANDPDNRTDIFAAFTPGRRT